RAPTPSLHDALPIYAVAVAIPLGGDAAVDRGPEGRRRPRGVGRDAGGQTGRLVLRLTTGKERVGALLRALQRREGLRGLIRDAEDRKSTRLNSSHVK